MAIAFIAMPCYVSACRNSLAELVQETFEALAAGRGSRDGQRAHLARPAS